jgi:hypothetical protein
MIQNNPKNQINSASNQDISNNFWHEIDEKTQELVRGGAVLAKWGNWQYSNEIGWHCQPGRVC